MNFQDIYSIFKYIKYEPVFTVNTVNNTITISLFVVANDGTSVELNNAMQDITQSVQETEFFIFDQINLIQCMSSIPYIDDGEVRCRVISETVYNTIEQYEKRTKTSVSSILLQNLRNKLLEDN